MNAYEFDFRYDWVSVTLYALKSAIDSVLKKGEDEPWFDGLWQMEHAESILGISYVAAQAYIVGAVEDVNRVRDSVGKNRLDKIYYYSDDPQPLPNGVSRILLINSLANYYKHHDEWDKWPTNFTTKTLADVGIVEGVEFPCCEASTKLGNEKQSDTLMNLLSIISEWRKHILSKYQ